MIPGTEAMLIQRHVSQYVTEAVIMQGEVGDGSDIPDMVESSMLTVDGL